MDFDYGPLLHETSRSFIWVNHGRLLLHHDLTQGICPMGFHCLGCTTTVSNPITFDGSPPQDENASKPQDGVDQGE